ncbi:MAG TPA: DUF664 domain-containing protein [Nonomuraea sp.]|nr:DUF664 domain-containing protein [Nonomuraea sp.]
MPSLLPPVPTNARPCSPSWRSSARRSAPPLRGLTLDQAVATPTAGALSLAAILKHVALVERRWVAADVAGRIIRESLDGATDLDRRQGA